MAWSSSRTVVGAIALTFVLAIAVGVSGVLVPRAQRAASGASTTLSIPSGDVLVRHGGADFVTAQDGEILAAGDAVRTAAGAHAVLTYFDGSTVEIEPSSELAIETATVGARGGTRIVMLQTFGRTWHVVTHLVTGDSTYEVRTPASTASVRGTTFSVEVALEAGVPVATVTTVEGAVATSDVASSAQVLVTAGTTTRVRQGSRPEQPRPKPQAQRTVVVQLDAPEGLVTDPAGRTNGVKDGKRVLQTPGAEVRVVDGKLVVTLPDIPDGKLSTRVDKARTGEVGVTTTLAERGRQPVKHEDRVTVGSDGKAATGTEVRRGEGGAPAVRPLREEEKKALPAEKVAEPPKPPQPNEDEPPKKDAKPAQGAPLQQGDADASKSGPSSQRKQPEPQGVVPKVELPKIPGGDEAQRDEKKQREKQRQEADTQKEGEKQKEADKDKGHGDAGGGRGRR